MYRKGEVIVQEVIKVLNSRYGETEMLRTFRDPYQLLVAVMLSARSRDSMTIPVAKKLFEVAPTPEQMVELSQGEIEKIIRPIGFFRSKAKYVQSLSKRLIEAYCGSVPQTREELITLDGVSRKTANVVLSQLWGKDVIAVDIHVHRISNRLGWIKTNKPEESEKALMRVVPKKYWRDINRVMVQHGQKVCLPRTPKCSACPIEAWCKKQGVELDK